MLKRKGAAVMDADHVVKDLLANDEKVERFIKRKFGNGMYSPSGDLNKGKLAAVVFKSPTRRRTLEGILHPRVRERMRDEILKQRKRIVVCDVPLLYESGWHKRPSPVGFSSVIVVEAKTPVRVKRLIKKGFSKSDINARMKAQWPLSRKTALADFVVNNNGTKKQTQKQVDAIWNKIANTLL
jgi:dephospho-CoA kinase